jgi:hypothetical protein
MRGDVPEILDRRWRRSMIVGFLAVSAAFLLVRSARYGGCDAAPEVAPRGVVISNVGPVACSFADLANHAHAVRRDRAAVMLPGVRMISHG